MQLVLETFLFLEINYSSLSEYLPRKETYPQIRSMVVSSNASERSEPHSFSLHQPTSIHQHTTLRLYFYFLCARYIISTSWHYRDCHVSSPYHVRVLISPLLSFVDGQRLSKHRLIPQLPSSVLRTILLNYHLTIAVLYVGSRRMSPSTSHNGKYIFRAPIYRMQLSFPHHHT